ncbi:hypothetical protein [Kosakonia cowanii]|jgi:hypothetical protein
MLSALWGELKRCGENPPEMGGLRIILLGFERHIIKEGYISGRPGITRALKKVLKTAPQKIVKRYLLHS